ncbi:Ig-like domain-containing protein [Rhodococcus sp. NPDC049939]|uniref:Ig-like domain-containing protein n=1 Tax=Rhodococcus sp. NPDC049939 TaxID=3155511 RepID=UPI0033DAD18B
MTYGVGAPNSYASTGDASAIPAFEGRLAPGQEVTQGWNLENESDQGGFVEDCLGEWNKTSPDVKVYARAQLGDDFGNKVDLAPDVDAVVTLTTPGGPNDVITNESVDLSAQVRGLAGNAVGGTVQFEENGTDIGNPVQLVDGRAMLPHTFTGEGAHEITAVYSGAHAVESSSGQAQTVTVTARTISARSPSDLSAAWGVSSERSRIGLGFV